MTSHPGATTAQREQTLKHLRATVPASAAAAASAIAGAVHRLGVTELLRAALLVAELDGLAAEDDDEPSDAG